MDQADSTKQNRRVGIMTLHYNPNAGSALQAYAIKRLVGELGFDAQVVNYVFRGNCRVKKAGCNVFCGPLSQWTPKHVAKWAYQRLASAIRMKKYLPFQRELLGVDVRKAAGLTSAPLPDGSEFHRVVVGSDQVWNFDLKTIIDKRYLLDYIADPAKKVAYGASMGSSDFPAESRQEIEDAIRQFRAVSCREFDGAERLSHIRGEDVPVVVDPTLVVDPTVWDKLADKVPAQAKNPYVYVYLREKSLRAMELAQSVAAKRGLEVLSVTCDRPDGKGKFKRQGPLEWLRCVRDASYVVTNSFHGVCFSLVFRKSFNAVTLDGDTWRAQTNSRITGLLAQVGLEGRYATGDAKPDCGDIDYGAVGRLLDARREQSRAWLASALRDGVQG